jgi:hypothetical protein
MIDQHFIHLRPVQAEDWPEIQRLGKENKTVPFFPTEVIVRNGKILGWVSQSAVPVIFPWTSKEVRAKDSVVLLSIVEGVQRRLGAPGIIFPCHLDSPFYPVMGKLGFTQGKNVDIFFKEL